MTNRAVFLDRDGTINEHVEGHVTSQCQFRFLPNSLEALRLLACSEYRIIVVTNQSAVARGLMTEESLEGIHERMLRDVESAGGRIDGIYSCLHHPEDRCGCRKPMTGLVELAAETYRLDLKGSWFVGDNTKDVETGARAGSRTILVATGLGGSDGLHKTRPTHTAKDLLEAVKLILR